MRVTTQTALWSAELVSRLRLRQAELADEPEELRARLLSEEIARATQALPAEQRRETLAAAAAQVAPEEPVTIPAAVPTPPPPPPPAPALPDDPAEVVAHLLSLLPKLAPEEVKAVADDLRASGLLPAPAVASSGLGDGPPEELQRRLEKLAPGRALDLRRSLRLLDVLLELTSNMDQLVWQIWKNVASNSVIHREKGRAADFRKYVAPYLTGDPEISTEQVKQSVEKTRQLVAGLLAAMGTIGEVCAMTVLSRLSPEAIRGAVGPESGVFDSNERKCWRKYTELFGEMNGPVLEKEVLGGVRKYIEKLILGAETASELEG